MKFINLLNLTSIFVEKRPNKRSYPSVRIPDDLIKRPLSVARYVINEGPQDCSPTNYVKIHFIISLPNVFLMLRYCFIFAILRY